MRTGTLALVLILGCASAPARAGVPQSELSANGMPENLAPFAARISSAEGGWESSNQFGCVGFFQACGATFTALYSGSKAQFLADRPGQVQAYLQYARTSWSQVEPYLGQLRGQQVTYGGKSFVIDDSAILFGMQFGLGRLRAFLRGGCEAPKAGPGTSPAIDGNGVSVCTYFGKGIGYDVSAITGSAYANLQPVQPGVPDTAEPGVPPLVEGSPQSSDTWSLEAGVLADRKRIAIERAIIANKELQIEAQRMDAERRLGLIWAMRVLADVDALQRRGAHEENPRPTAGTSGE